LATATVRPKGGGFRLKADPAIAANEESDAEARRHALWSLLPRMTVPVLVVRGIGSAVLRQHVVDAMMAALPDGQSRSVGLAGHGVMLDNPTGFAEAVCPFLTRIADEAEQPPEPCR
jgi:pimeloyl-ACP methyl ester carboxylesterase